MGWTDALTRLSEGADLAAARAALEGEFTPEEQVKLTLMINVINGWNRLACAFDLWIEPTAAKAHAKASIAAAQAPTAPAPATQAPAQQAALA